MMKIYVWLSNITNAYHNDATLVVLASSLKEARKVALEKYPIDEDGYGNLETKFLTQEPDDVFEIDKPMVVAFNYGADD